jgi:cell division protein ZapA
MNKMNDIEVIINNKRYNLRGYESEEYLHKIASYINNKHLEFKKQDFYRMLDSEMKNVLMQINVADDYFKIRQQVKEIEVETDNKSNEIFEIKHDLISTQTKLDASIKQIEALKQELNEAQKNIIRLETELLDKNRT